MPQAFDESYEPHLWRCDECRRVLGVVMRDLYRIRRLWIFRIDRDDVDVPKTKILRRPPKGLFKVHGCNSCDGVECSHCGAICEWSMSKEAFDTLMVRYAKKVVKV
jgi:hypothetical protein